MPTSCNVHGAGQAAQRQVGADEDGSWRQDRVTPVADRKQQRPQLQQQQAACAGPEALVAFLRVSPRPELMHTCSAHGRQKPARRNRNQHAPSMLHSVMDAGGIALIFYGS